MRLFNSRIRFLAAASIAALLGASAMAQDDVDDSLTEDEEIEEIVVIAGPRTGDPVDVEARYEAQLRERILKDLQRLREIEEEDAWRSSLATHVEGPSRISWGYDPDDELRARRDTEMTDMNFETTKPATVFRVGF